MFRGKFLVCVVFFSLVIIGLVACAKPEDQIVTRKAFLQVQAECRARTTESVPCVMGAFKLMANDYCATHELSSANPKCVHIVAKVRDKVSDNFTENVRDIFK